MGIKARVFRPLVNVSLEDLVPADHCYRHLDRTLDLTFVRDLVRDRYSAFGRPSIDLVVFFKLQLVMFFEGMRSERQMERVGADRLSVRWYLGYDLHEPLPDHSSMTRIRERYAIQIFRRFFEAIVEQCRKTGLVWGQELYADDTLVEANADRDKMLPPLSSRRICSGCLATPMHHRLEPIWHGRDYSCAGRRRHSRLSTTHGLGQALFLVCPRSLSLRCRCQPLHVPDRCDLALGSA